MLIQQCVVLCTVAFVSGCAEMVNIIAPSGNKRYFCIHTHRKVIMRLVLSILFFPLFIGAAYGQNLIAPTTTPLEDVELLLLPGMDNASLLAAELERRAPGRPPKFAEAIAVEVQPEQYGLWETLTDGTAVWRLRIASPGAHSLNLGFTEYYMPPQGRMIIYGPDKTQVLGPFSPADNETHDQLWTPVFPGDELILEVQLPASLADQLRLFLSVVNHDFANFLSITSGACNLDVVCGAEDGFPIVELYRDVIQSAGVYSTGGDTFCSGFLVNNASSNCSPYFITAFHCNINQFSAPTVVAYWNYQNSSCRPPGSVASGNPGDGQLNNFNTGTIWRAGHQDTDFTLLEFDDPIPSAAEAFLAGWSRSTLPPQDTLVCIHHPDGAEKRITIAYEDAYPGVWSGGSTEVEDGNHLIIPDWSIGSTESGSSGAPLFNTSKQFVGQLHGGAASCSNDSYDSFGWFRYAWEGGGSPQSRLKDWLDPNNLDLLTLNGRWLSSCDANIELATNSSSACSPGEATFVVEINEFFPMEVSLSTSGLPAGSVASFSPNPASPGSTSTLTLDLPDDIPAGLLSFSILAEDQFNDYTTTAQLQLTTEVPNAPTPTSPAPSAIGLSLAPVIKWEYTAAVSHYEVEVATEPGFYTITQQANNIQSDSFQLDPLDDYTTYYYRIRAYNICGAGEWSLPVPFTTSVTDCASYLVADVPKVIGESVNEYVTSSLYIPAQGTVSRLSISNLDITHSYVGDISAFLTSPSGTIVQLFDRPGHPVIAYGCENDNMLISLADDAPLNSYELETSCNTGIAVQGTFQPLSPLAAFIGEPIEGEWRLTVVDHESQGSGQINGWQLDLCSTLPHTPEVFFNPIYACTDTQNVSKLFIGYGFQDSVSLNAFNLPGGFSVSFDPLAAAPGTYVDMYISGLSAEGVYDFVLVASDSYNNHICNAVVNVIEQAVEPLLLTPDNNSPVFNDEPPLFSWSPIPSVDTFILTIAQDYQLTDIVYQTSVVDPYYVLTSPLESGTYFWAVVAANWCGKEQSSIFSFSTSGTTNSMQQTAEEDPLEVFPNPVSSVLNIKMGTNEHAVGALYNNQGQPVLAFSFSQATQLSMEQLPAGLYLLKVQLGHKLMTRKIIHH
jgi:subtilisin-like proprotein convertase family protein